MQRIFGGYTDKHWTSDIGYKAGSGNSFLFYTGDDMNFIKLRCKNRKREVHHYKVRLCCFGGTDLLIYSDCNIKYNSSSELGFDY